MYYNYNSDFNFAAVALLIILYIYLKFQYSGAQKSTRILRRIVITMLFLSLFDIMSFQDELFLPKYSSILRHVSFSLYCLTEGLAFFIFFTYVEYVLGVEKKATVASFALRYFPLLFYAEFIAYNFRNPVLFKFNAEGYLSYGYFSWIITVVPLYYAIYVVVLLIKQRKAQNIKVTLPIITFLSFSFVCAMTQVLFIQEIAIFPFSVAIGVLILQISLESPDYESILNAQKKLEAAREHSFDANNKKERHLERNFKKLEKQAKDILTDCSSFEKLAKDRSDMESVLLLKSNATLMINTLDNYKTHLQITENTLKTDNSEYDINEIITEVYNIVKPKAIERGIRFTITHNPRLPEKLRGDRRLIRQVILNYAIGALSYTAGGSADMNIDFSTEDHKSIQLGIFARFMPSEQCLAAGNNIFDVYDKSYSYRTEKTASSKIELKVCKEIVKVLEGNVWSNIAEGCESLIAAEINQKL